MPPDPVPGPGNASRAGRGARSLSRARDGLFLVGIPVTAIVMLELVAASVLLSRAVSALTGAIVIAAAVLVALVVLVTFRGARVATWIAIAAQYAPRRHVVSAASRRNDAEDAIVMPREVTAFFPGMRVRNGAMHGGSTVGLVEWQGQFAAIVAVAAPANDVLDTAGAQLVRVQDVISTLAGHGFALDAVQVVTQSLHGSGAGRFEGSALAAVASELSEAGPLVRGREMWIAVRIDPIVARDAVNARGGGFPGLSGLAAAALSRIESVLRTGGLVARTLDAESAVRAMAAALLQPVTGDDAAPLRWIESWKDMSSAQVHHRAFVVTSWHDHALDDVALPNAYGLTVAHEVQRLDDTEGVRVLSVVRLSALSASQLDAVSDQLRAGCRQAGIGLRLLRGRQAPALRATIPGGLR